MPKENFNLDDFKKSWQEQKPEVYESSEIEAMLNKKSKNYVKYILWISIAEFVLFALMNMYTVFLAPHPNSFLEMLKKLGIHITPSIDKEFQQIYLVLKVLSLLITAIFVGLFYHNYKKIRIEYNLKKFISQIIFFKKTVHLFILTNISVLVLFTGILTLFALNTLKFQNIDLNKTTLLGFLIGVVISLVIGVLLILVYYRVVYGILLKRLDNQLKQLQKIEQEKE